MMYRLFVLISILLVTAVTSHAQVLIIGGEAGQDCYRAVKFNPSPGTRHERICTDAIASGALDRVNLAGTLINRGIIRMRMGDFGPALEDYARAERMTPHSGALHLNKGAALIGIGDYDAALVSLNRALELETQEPYAAHYNIGVAHEYLGQAAPAYESYQAALELKPDWSLPTRALERFTVERE